MCTVTFVNSNGKHIITSNRDEKIVRPKSIAPKTYLINSKKVFFPKDPKAGGTWYAVDDAGDVLVLLNGATEKHIQKQEYKKSRGLIVLEIIGSENCLQHWETISLENIEPFTLVYYSKKRVVPIAMGWKYKRNNSIRQYQKLHLVFSNLVS